MALQERGKGHELIDLLAIELAKQFGDPPTTAQLSALVVTAQTHQAPG